MNFLELQNFPPSKVSDYKSIVTPFCQNSNLKFKDIKNASYVDDIYMLFFPEPVNFRLKLGYS